MKYLLLLAITLNLFACGYSAMDSIDEEIEEYEDKAEVEYKILQNEAEIEKNKAQIRYLQHKRWQDSVEAARNNALKSSSSYFITSSSSNLYYYLNSISSSSSVVSNYTPAKTTVSVILTYYKQLKTMDWAGTTDGDPRITFILKTYKNNTLQETRTTSQINLGDNVGIWSGTRTRTVSFSSSFDRLNVNPQFVDADVTYDDTEYDSGYSYNIYSIGTKMNQKIYQSDDYASYFNLEWYMYLEST